MTLKTKILFICLPVILLAGLLYFLFAPPSDFPRGYMVDIHSGQSLTEIGITLKNAHLIRSASVFNMLMISLNHEHDAVSGMYLFKQPVNVYEIAKRISGGDFGFPVKKVTIPEGTTIKEISLLIPKDFVNFSVKTFIASTTKKEGYLFPVTYFFPTNANAGDVIKRLSDTFDEKMTPLRADILISNRTEKDVITMASILEEEALTTEDRKIIAGILWKRIKIGMRLQVDAPLDYERGKNTFELTLADLKKDSPYNTYTRKGLPPTPISNPGLDAINSAIYPTETKYFYYLSDKKGIMHYAETYDQHLVNKRKYLR